MESDTLQITTRNLARFIIMRQHLSGHSERKKTDVSSRILKVLDHIRYLQLDPVRAVEKSHFLTLWSRIGDYRQEALADLIYTKHLLTESYAHMAAISLAEDMHLLSIGMLERRERLFMKHPDISVHFDKVKNFLEANGPMYSSQFPEFDVGSALSGWGHERKINLLLDLMHWTGDIVICNRSVSGQKLWSLPPVMFENTISSGQSDRNAAEKEVFMKSLYSLGIASSDQILRYYTPFRIAHPGKVVEELINEQKVITVEITGMKGVRKKSWYVLKKDINAIEKIENVWKPRSVLLSPFDNLIIDRKRTMEIFDFDGRLEMYINKSKRKYGFYAMPFLHGDRIVGRIDPKFDRKAGILKVNAIHDEGKYFSTSRTLRALLDSIDSLGNFVQATKIELPNLV